MEHTYISTYLHMKVVPILKKENDTACLTAFQESTIVCGFLTHAVNVFFRTCNVLTFSCTHLPLWRGSKDKVKDPRYMQNKKDPRISLPCSGFR